MYTRNYIYSYGPAWVVCACMEYTHNARIMYYTYIYIHVNLIIGYIVCLKWMCFFFALSNSTIRTKKHVRRSGSQLFPRRDRIDSPLCGSSVGDAFHLVCLDSVGVGQKMSKVRADKHWINLLSQNAWTVQFDASTWMAIIRLWILTKMDFNWWWYTNGARTRVLYFHFLGATLMQLI